jgi:hypothetical protein
VCEKKKEGSRRRDISSHRFPRHFATRAAVPRRVVQEAMDSVEQLKAGIQRAEVAGEALKLTSRTGVELDRKRQGNRECLRALRKQDIAARERRPGDPRPPARSFQFRPGGVIVRVTREESIAALERDQERLEADITANEVAKKKALKDLNDKGGVPDSVGQGLLNAFVNLRDDTKESDAEARRAGLDANDK